MIDALGRLIIVQMCIVGVKTSWAFEFNVPVGWTMGFDFGVTSNEVETEISTKFGTSVEYSSFQTKLISKQFKTYDTDVRVNYWQEMHEYRIVDETGALFTDPNYELKSITIGVIGVDNFVTSTDRFLISDYLNVH